SARCCRHRRGRVSANAQTAKGATSDLPDSLCVRCSPCVSVLAVTVHTIGHSTRTLDEFVALLRAHEIIHLADVRTVPKSRRYPHFAREALSRSLPAAGIAYRHVAGLGGLRKPRQDSPNTAWRHESFRGYADYMQTPAFQEALDELIEWSAVPTV